MTQSGFNSRRAWEDRWNTPGRDQLIEPIKMPAKRAVEHLLDDLAALEGVRTDMTYFGPGWKWSFQFTLHDEDGRPVDVLAYVVPNPEGPLACIPLTDEVMQNLPQRKLPRSIKEGLKSAKRAVATHWASWSINNSTDYKAVMELVEHKIRLTREQFQLAV